jgi:hypothetical protein
MKSHMSLRIGQRDGYAEKASRTFNEINPNP